MRDEMKVKLHLARADARDEWDELEKKLEHLKARLGVAGEEAGKAAQDVGAALKLVAAELRKGYERVRQTL
jgi:hypothetical protein